MAMCTKYLINLRLLTIAFLYSYSIEAKIIHANNYHEAISKAQQKSVKSKLFRHTHEKLGIQRFYILSKYNSYWEQDNNQNDTLYICDLGTFNGFHMSEYIITKKRVYAIENGEKYSPKYSVTPYDEQVRCKYIMEHIKNWDVDLFERWKTTTINDYTFVHAYRMVRLSKNKYQYDFYSFCDNYSMEHDPLEGWD